VWTGTGVKKWIPVGNPATSIYNYLEFSHLLSLWLTYNQNPCNDRQILSANLRADAGRAIEKLNF